MRTIYQFTVFVFISLLMISCKDSDPVAAVVVSEFELISIAEDSCLALDEISIFMKKFDLSDSTLKLFVDGISANYRAMTPTRLKVEVPKKAVQGNVTATWRGKEIFNRKVKIGQIEILSSNKDSVFFFDDLTLNIRNRKDLADDSMALYAGGVRVDSFKILPSGQLVFKVPQGISDCNIFIESYGRVSNTFHQRLAGARDLEITNIEQVVKYPDDLLRFAVRNVNMDYDPELEILVGGISTRPFAQNRDVPNGVDYVIVRVPANTQTNTLQVKYLGKYSEVKNFKLGALPAPVFDLSKYSKLRIIEPADLYLPFTITKDEVNKRFIIHVYISEDVGWRQSSKGAEILLDFSGRLLNFSYSSYSYTHNQNKTTEQLDINSTMLSLRPTENSGILKYSFEYPSLVQIHEEDKSTDPYTGEVRTDVKYSSSAIINIELE